MRLTKVERLASAVAKNELVHEEATQRAMRARKADSIFVAREDARYAEGVMDGLKMAMLLELAERNPHEDEEWLWKEVKATVNRIRPMVRKGLI